MDVHINREVYLLPAMGKIFERIVAIDSQHFWKRQTIHQIDENQAGFRKKT